MACRERVLLALLRALEVDGAAGRPGLNFPPSPALRAHAYLRGCLPPHSPLPHRRPPLLPAPRPADSLARTSLGLPLADWLRPGGPGDVISETWQPGKSAPQRGGGREGAVGGAGGGRRMGVGAALGTLLGEERGVGTQGTAGVRRRGGEGAGGHWRRVLRPGLLCWLPPSCWSQDVLRTEKESGGLCRKRRLWGTRSPSFSFPPHSRYWHYYFLFSRLTLSFDPCSDLRSLDPAVTSKQPNYFCLPCSRPSPHAQPDLSSWMEQRFHHDSTTFNGFTFRARDPELTKIARCSCPGLSRQVELYLFLIETPGVVRTHILVLTALFNQLGNINH